jgi:hypothetical protein
MPAEVPVMRIVSSLAGSSPVIRLSRYLWRFRRRIITRTAPARGIIAKTQRHKDPLNRLTENFVPKRFLRFRHAPEPSGLGDTVSLSAF